MLLTKNTKVADWYKKEFPEDKEISLDPNVTFGEVIKCINNNPGKFYVLIGDGDSLVRERIFTAIAKILKKSYQAVYDRWLDNNAPELVESALTESQKLNVNGSAIKNEIIKQAKKLFKMPHNGTTIGIPLGTWGKNRWAVVLAWQDPEMEDEWDVYAKVAYQPTNAIMQEYDIDWLMPYDEKTGAVDDTEVRLDASSLSSDAGFLVKDWLRIAKELEKEEIEESTLTEERKKAIYDTIVEGYVLDGYSLTEALALAEDTITPEMINNLENTPAFKKLKKEVEYYFKAVDGIEGYRDGDFKKAPVKALQGEAEFCKDAADFLGSIKLQGFKPEVKKELMNATAKDVEYLDNSALRLNNILKKQDDSVYLNDDGSVNKQTNQKPGEYARRALRKIRDFFARLGQDFAYDPDFDYSAIKDVDYRNLVADYESRAYKANKKVLESGNLCWEKVEIKLECPDQSQKEELIDAARDSFEENIDNVIDAGFIGNSDIFEIEFSDKVKYEYTKGKITGINTGDPDLYEITDGGIDEYEIYDELHKWKKAGLKFKILKVDVDFE